MKIWKKALTKKPLIKLIPDLKEGQIVNYREEKDKVYVRYTFQQTIIDKKDLKKYFEPIIENGKIKECKPDVSDSLEENFQKVLKKKSK